MRTSVRNVVIVGVVAFATLLSSGAWALPLSQVFFPEANRLIGDPRRGTDEIYLNAAGATYLNPDNLINGTLPVAGQVPGQIESLRNVGIGYTGINIPQPCDVTGVPADPRSVLGSNPAEVLAGANPLVSNTWGVRAGAAVQWQTDQDGSAVSLTPLGVNSGQAYNITPGTLFSVAFGLNPAGVPTIVSPVDVGGAPGSVGGDGLADFVPWVRDLANPNQLVTGFGINGLDRAAIDGYFAALGPNAFGVGVTPAQVYAALIARVDVWEGGALFDQVAGSFDARNFNHNGGTNGMAGDELNDAVDGTLLLSGELSNIQIQNYWTAQILLDGQGRPVLNNGQFVAVPGTVKRTIKIVADVTYDGGTLLHWLSTTHGVISANYNGIPFTNVDTVTNGTHANPAAYDFIGDRTTSYDASQTFQAIPEPLTMLSGVLAIGALGGYIRRRR